MSSNTYEKLIKFSKNSGIHIKKILDLLFEFKKSDKLQNHELITNLGLSKTALNLIQKEFYSWFKPASQITELTLNGQDAAQIFVQENYMNDSAIFDFLLPDAEKLLKDSQSFYNNRPQMNRDLDQFHATYLTTAKRAALLNFLGDIKYKKILFLGDDDFTSLTVALYSDAHEIFVVDKDIRILKAIEKLSKENGLKIQTLQYDAVNSLPKALLNRFDVIFTDPPYTPSGISLFISRAINALDYKNKTARIYFCYGASDLSKERFVQINKIIADMQLMPRYIFDKFNKYLGAESIGSTSSLYVCDATGLQKPLVKGVFTGNLYTNQ